MAEGEETFGNTSYEETMIFDIETIDEELIQSRKPCSAS